MRSVIISTILTSYLYCTLCGTTPYWGKIMRSGVQTGYHQLSTDQSRPETPIWVPHMGSLLCDLGALWADLWRFDNRHRFKTSRDQNQPVRMPDTPCLSPHRSSRTTGGRRSRITEFEPLFKNRSTPHLWTEARQQEITRRF